ncbi:AzlC family ABC transporter permease [Glaesserella parasuis]|uniref:AzlC family ABC transporter permease n=1 Tax=Glaesserella parasuis TaxID=738 RepID=UPI00136668A7|nr:AzlC family ABC transporter permease [Glaesserella parasuis]MCT8535519.1 AzlC family ABC transporter permease [Glaesserella parasuis]MCT8570595.1 AzlC family ABC transporter permease [Glaesserella parasuis]MCT8605854.1 AzlC family ABC transporter permease [Glaesserella parasuis]MCT8638127.1 AzlC family ABC transporter permease [Glaesserella parasuis]MCT8652563.1 AzlC family ABC transporter permease [Glaesserella parasuis]
MSFNTENSWKSAFKLTVPIFMGYLAAGIAYGMLATNAGMPAWFTVVMCFTVFSGTAQYAAIPFFVSGAGVVSVFLSTLLMSLRFIFYTLNMHSSLPKEKLNRFFALSYLTDENFGVLTTLPQETRQAMMFKISILGMSYWTFATIVGILLGDSVSQYIPNLDFALPCLFAILAYEQYSSQKQWKPIFIALIGFLLAGQITQTSVLLVAIIIAIIIVAFLPQSFTEKKGQA